MFDWLNYHHLLYFWTVAKEGGITRAAEKLHLSQPTLSTQIQKLEKSMGVKLFDRKSRTMVLTDTGQTVFRYADEIFNLGRELTDVIRGRSGDKSLRLLVGIPDVMPKMIVYRLLKPAMTMTTKVRLTCYEGKLNDLLSDLAMHKLDVVLANTRLTSELSVRAFSHLLGQCDITVCGTSEMARKYKPGFPKSLNAAPMLLPTQNTTMRRALEQWFDDADIRPETMHEFEDSALMKVFAQAGAGMVAIPTAVMDEVTRQYGLRPIGRISEIVENFYAISVERRIKHPAVLAISHAAKESLFQDQSANE